jgi:hypothetical protein
MLASLSTSTMPGDRFQRCLPCELRGAGLARCGVELFERAGGLDERDGDAAGGAYVRAGGV